MRRSTSIAILAALALSAGCGGDYEVLATDDMARGSAAKGDGWDSTRQYEVLLTDPHCDVCTPADKDYLKTSSVIAARVVALIDGATTTVDVAQFTFSNKDIEAALVRAHQRGVAVRVAMNAAQDQSGSLARRLRDAGLDVRFVAGRDNGSWSGLQHAKYMLVDGHTVLSGSNNWSSTGVSINEENTIVVHAPADDPLVAAYACNFEAIAAGDLEAAPRCSTDEVKFTPSSGPNAMIRDALREASASIDVLMHHLVFDKLVKELAKAAERGVRVRIIVNAADRAEVQGGAWDRFYAAGGEVRFKRSNADLYQLMHHKLAIVDDALLLNGSGNWSGSAFFNNFEVFVRYGDPRVVAPFVGLYDRLWTWSLSGASLDAGRSPAEQHAAENTVFFGNLHAHHAAGAAGSLQDDGVLEHHDEHGETVHDAPGHGDGARYAFEYARDQGGMDFMALTPHCTADTADQPADMANASQSHFDHLVHLAESVTDASSGQFVAMAGMEWNTNSQGNHVTVIGSKALAKITKGRFDELYGGWLPERTQAGDHALIGFNHPRTLRRNEESLGGNWDQVYGVSLADIPKTGQRKVKFNDYGLDDYPPLNTVYSQWISGAAIPDEGTVAETLANVAAASRPWARFMEVLIGRGKEIRHELGQNPSLTEAEDGTIERYTRVHSDWDYYLLHGFHLAPTAPHDNHYANWGTGHTSRTGVVARALSEASLLDAVDRRALFATEDPNLELRVYADGRSPMGSEIRTLAGTVRLDVQTFDPDYTGDVRAVVWLGTEGGSEVRPVQEAVLSSGQWTSLGVTLPGPGTHFAYLEITETGADRMAWSAPIWVEQLQ